MTAEFKLSKEEQEAAKKFEVEHSHKDINKGAIGGHIIYMFAPNSIYRALGIKCSICGKVENITDYDNW